MSDQITKSDRLALMIAREGKERSRALPQGSYRDPAVSIIFEAEKGKRMQETLGTKEIESILKHEIDNWIRWGRKRDWMPVGFSCPLGFLYVSTDVHEASYKPLPCIEGVAADFERVVMRLPKKHKDAMVMHLLDRAHVLGIVRIAKGRDEKARLLGLQKSRYHEMVSQAFNIVLREWRKRRDR